MARTRLSRYGKVETADGGGLQVQFNLGQASDADPTGPAGGASGPVPVGLCCGRCPGVTRPRVVPASLLGALPMAPSLGDGETVEVSIDAGGLHRTVVMLFGLPLALLFGGAWLGAQVGGEQLSAVAGLAGAMAGLLWFRRAGPGLMRSLAMRVTASPRTVISHGTPVDDRLVSARSEVWS